VFKLGLYDLISILDNRLKSSLEHKETASTHPTQPPKIRKMGAGGVGSGTLNF